MVLLTKRLVAAAKFLFAATKILFVVPDFVAVKKTFFPWAPLGCSLKLTYFPHRKAEKTMIG